MKTLILIILLSASQVFSQVILTNSINPTPGNTQRIVNCDTTGITQGNSGTNQTWNFTSLTRQDSSLLTWVTASSTPYAAQFPTSNVASTNDNSNYNYFTTSAANLLTNGTAGPTLVIPYSNPELFMQYPFAYGNTFTDNFAATYTSGGSQVTRTGTITVTADAWGTINLPFSSFSNSLRVKYLISTKDSSNPGTPFVIITNLTSYEWFVPGRKFPVFEIIYVAVTFNGTPFSNIKVVDYNPNSTPIGIIPISAEVPDKFSLSQNYPNPFNPSTRIHFAIPGALISNLCIYDILGREVATLVSEHLKAGIYEVEWNAGNYPSGVYYYKLTAGEFSETKKMILIK
jgi:type IX secretion system substrate protein